MNATVTTPAPEKKPIIGIEVTVEGEYWGTSTDSHGAPGIHMYSANLLLPPDYNRGNKGMSYIFACIIGTVTGTPVLKVYKDSKGRTPYANFKAKRTINLVDWQEITDEKRIPELLVKKQPDQMSADQLKSELTKLGVVYPNPARKSELVELLLKAQDKKAAEPDAGERPTFVGPDQRPLDETKVIPGQTYESSAVDPANPNLPAATNVSIESSFSV